MQNHLLLATHLDHNVEIMNIEVMVFDGYVPNDEEMDLVQENVFAVVRSLVLIVDENDDKDVGRLDVCLI